MRKSDSSRRKSGFSPVSPRSNSLARRLAHQQIAIAYAQLGDLEACDHHMAQYRASLPDSYDEKLLFESHLRLCERDEDREHWREGYRLIGMDV